MPGLINKKIYTSEGHLQIFLTSDMSGSTTSTRVFDVGSGDVARGDCGCEEGTR